MIDPDVPPLEPIPENVKRRLLKAARWERYPYAIQLLLGGVVMRFLETAMVTGVFVLVVMWLGLGVGFDSGVKIKVFLIALTIGLLVLANLFHRPVRRFQTLVFRKKYCKDGKLPFCIGCEYDLRGVPGMVCPECGEPEFRFSK